MKENGRNNDKRFHIGNSVDCNSDHFEFVTRDDEATNKTHEVGYTVTTYIESGTNKVL